MRIGIPALMLLCVAAGAARADQTPGAAETLERVGFAEADKAKVLSGEFVARHLQSATKRDLAVALSFLVTRSPWALDRSLIHKTLSSRDPHTLETGPLSGNAHVAELAALSLSPQERRLYLEASPGNEVNLSEPEFAAIAALNGEEPKVDATMRDLLLRRYLDYRAKGLSGIAPYARGRGKSRDVAGDLRRASDAAQAIKAYPPRFYRLLHDYPSDRPSDFTESFDWSRYRARGAPTLILSHEFSSSVGDGFVFVQRQYYVSRGFNAEQAIAGFIPVSEGTLVVYTNHTSTDQVEGVGGGAKRSIADRVMVSQLQALFGRIREQEAQQ